MKKTCKLTLFLLLFAMLQPAVAALRDPTEPAFAGAQITTSAPAQPLLEAILLAGARQLAVISGNIYRVGDLFQGDRIVAMDAGHVQLEGARGKLTLTLLPMQIRRDIKGNA